MVKSLDYEVIAILLKHPVYACLHRYICVLESASMCVWVCVCVCVRVYFVCACVHVIIRFKLKLAIHL